MNNVVVPPGVSGGSQSYSPDKVSLENLTNEVSLLNLGIFEPLKWKIDCGQFMREIEQFKDDTFIPMYFEKDFNLSSFLADTHDHTIGKHSFKWNLHSTDKQFNLERLEQRLNFITRCPSN